MDLIEGKDVSDLDISKTGYSEEVARRQNMFSTSESGYNILRWL